MINILKKDDLKKHGHDVYEFCTAANYPNNWSENSIYLSMENFKLISPYIDKKIKNYHYFGPQKVTVKEWISIKNIALLKKHSEELIVFFQTIDYWIEENNSDYSYFWILGI